MVSDSAQENTSPADDPKPKSSRNASDLKPKITNLNAESSQLLTELQSSSERLHQLTVSVNKLQKLSSIRSEPPEPNVKNLDFSDLHDNGHLLVNAKPSERRERVSISHMSSPEEKLHEFSSFSHRNSSILDSPKTLSKKVIIENVEEKISLSPHSPTNNLSLPPPPLIFRTTTSSRIRQQQRQQVDGNSSSTATSAISNGFSGVSTSFDVSKWTPNWKTFEKFRNLRDELPQVFVPLESRWARRHDQFRDAERRLREKLSVLERAKERRIMFENQHSLGWLAKLLFRNWFDFPKVFATLSCAIYFVWKKTDSKRLRTLTLIFTVCYVIYKRVYSQEKGKKILPLTFSTEKRRRLSGAGDNIDLNPIRCRNFDDDDDEKDDLNLDI